MVLGRGIREKQNDGPLAEGLHFLLEGKFQNSLAGNRQQGKGCTTERFSLGGRRRNVGLSHKRFRAYPQGADMRDSFI